MKSHCLWALFVLAIVAQIALATPLDDYVAAPDPNYSFTLVNTVKSIGYTAYIIDMKSQSWRKSSEVDRTLWQHWLTIIKPDGAAGDTALLWINGGSNRGSPPSSADMMLAGIAISTRTVVVDLKTVPNEPLVFPDGGGPRSEDAIIAYTFDKYMKTGDQTWPLLLPMVKSAVRAMDTVSACLSSLPEGALKVNKFVVCGGSKRGWTTWLTAAVDKRVVAIAPAVIDVLNMDEQMKHHYSAYGFYSSAIHDYVALKVFERLSTPEGQALVKFIDPYEYRSRYTMPKFLVDSSGDQFFLPDSAQFYFKDLIGEKYIRYVPNTDHGLANSDAPMSLMLFYKSILAGSPRPKFSWLVKEDGSIVVKTTTAPTAVNLWQASNTKARDFRLETIGPAWKSSSLADQGGGTYIGSVPEPNEGWTAFFVELLFDSGYGIPHKFTTQVNVVPNRLPFSSKLGFDTDCDVYFDDLAILLGYRLSDGPAVDIATLCGDGIIDLRDYALFAAERQPPQLPSLVLNLN